MYLHYAAVIGDYARVAEHWIMEEEWLKAIDVLNRQVRNYLCARSTLANHPLA